jgi:DNA-directed RNA polymerase subunit M/transcription elongation factor TFIIS
MMQKNYILDEANLKALLTLSVELANIKVRYAPMERQWGEAPWWHVQIEASKEALIAVGDAFRLNGKQHCPFCRSEKVVYQPVHTDNKPEPVTYLVRPAQCSECYSVWDELFKLDHLYYLGG